MYARVWLTYRKRWFDPAKALYHRKYFYNSKANLTSYIKLLHAYKETHKTHQTMLAYIVEWSAVKRADLLVPLFFSSSHVDIEDSSSVVSVASRLVCSTVSVDTLLHVTSPGTLVSGFCLDCSALGFSVLTVSKNWSNPCGSTPFRPTLVKKLHEELLLPWWLYTGSFLKSISALFDDCRRSRCIISSVE